MIESSEGRMNCYFNFTDEAAMRRFSDPLYKGVTICNEDLSISFHRKRSVKMNQCWAVGFSILELSKFIMQQLFYKVIKPRFGGRASVLMSDTDSFVLELPCTGPDEAVIKLRDVMDFSNYPPDHPLYDPSSKNQLGLLKNELPGDIIHEFVGIKSKVYAIKTKSNKMESKAKGVKQAYKAKIPFDRYKACITSQRMERVVQVAIGCKDHQNMIIRSNRVAFTSFDDKRYLLCNRHSTPYGSIFQKHFNRTAQCYFCENPDVLT